MQISMHLSPRLKTAQEADVAAIVDKQGQEIMLGWQNEIYLMVPL